MMRNILFTIFIAVAFSSCTTQKSMYSWYNYENINYEYSKKGTDELRVKLLDEYEKMISKQSGVRNAVPPGIYAEYGFLLCKMGKTEEGIAYLKEEMKSYPESEKYISRIIKQLEQ